MNDPFLAELSAQIDDFVAERDWQQFHSPKNLAMALIVEAAELVEHFQWLDAVESDALDEAKRGEVADELADILIYTLRLAGRLDIDLEQAALTKMEKNRRKYPAEKARGVALKYNKL